MPPIMVFFPSRRVAVLGDWSEWGTSAPRVSLAHEHVSSPDWASC